MASGKEINVIDKCKRKKFSASARNLYCNNITKKLKYVLLVEIILSTQQINSRLSQLNQEN